MPESNMLIECDGALFRAKNYDFPTELWSVKDPEWTPYTGKVPKPPAWGDAITDEEAEELKQAF